MRTHPTNLRQAEESAAPKQTFESPQAEIRHIKRTNRTLAGFARILEIIRDTDFFEIDQRLGHVRRNWLSEHSTQCGACVGALLCWFFDGPVSPDGKHRFIPGIERLAAHLGVDDRDAIRIVGRGRRRTAARTGAAPDFLCPFGSDQWSADYADVFYELAREYPGK